MSGSGKQSDRLAFLGQLAGGLAHEIKNPLSTMMVTLQLLKEDWDEETSPRAMRTRQKLELLLKEVHRLEGILDEFLRYARGADKSLAPCDLNDLVQEVLDFIEPETARFGIRIRFAPAADLPECRVDRNAIKQALFNIVINAQHAMENDGGELIVTTERLADPEAAKLRIVDTGCGIEPDVLTRIFDVYYSTKQRGTGLGLPTSRRFIEEHDGSITVQSDVGRGTAVEVILPISGPAASTVVGEGAEEGAGDG